MALIYFILLCFSITSVLYSLIKRDWRMFHAFVLFTPYVFIGFWFNKLPVQFMLNDFMRMIGR